MTKQKPDKYGNLPEYNGEKNPAYQSDIPSYILATCKSKYITHCEWYMHNDCKRTCPYAKGIGGLGIGGLDPETIKRLDDVQDY